MNTPYDIASGRKEMPDKKETNLDSLEELQRNNWLTDPITIERLNKIKVEYNKLIDVSLALVSVCDDEKAVKTLIRAKAYRDVLDSIKQK